MKNRFYSLSSLTDFESQELTPLILNKNGPSLIYTNRSDLAFMTENLSFLKNFDLYKLPY